MEQGGEHFHKFWIGIHIVRKIGILHHIAVQYVCHIQVFIQPQGVVTGGRFRSKAVSVYHIHEKDVHVTAGAVAVTRLEYKIKPFGRNFGVVQNHGCPGKGTLMHTGVSFDITVQHAEIGLMKNADFDV